MTCIVGVEMGDRVVMGGDIQGSSPMTKIVHTRAKVFTVGDLIFGYTTSYRFGQIIENFLPEPHVPADSDRYYEWLIGKLIPDIKGTLERHGWKDGGSCLIGVGGELWAMQDEFSVLRSVNGYNAVGSGEFNAMGALYALNRHTAITDDNVDAVIRTAIQAAAENGPYVGYEVVIKDNLK